MEPAYIYLPKVIIDTHCHGRDFIQARKTTIEQVLREARRGMIDITCFMPNTNPPNIILEVLFEIIDLIKQAEEELKLAYKQRVYFGATDNNWQEYEFGLRHPRVAGGKIYPKGVTTGNEIGIFRKSSIRYALEIGREVEKPTSFHCSDPVIFKKNGEDTIKGEVSFLREVIKAGKEVPGAKIVICHPSCKESMREIQLARYEGLDIIPELMPHYLWFDKEGANWNPNLDPVFYHVFNSLRGAEHRDYLSKNFLASDNVAMVASDSACHTRKEKLADNPPPGGIPSNQEMVAVIATLAYQLGISKKRIADLLSFNASETFGISVPKEFVKYRLEERVVDYDYNNGAVENPWRESRLLFPVPIEKEDLL